MVVIYRKLEFKSEIIFFFQMITFMVFLGRSCQHYNEIHGVSFHLYHEGSPLFPIPVRVPSFTWVERGSPVYRSVPSSRSGPSVRPTGSIRFSWT